MLAIERKKMKFYRFCKRTKSAGGRLSTRYQVTEETIRRDLEAGKEGFVKRPTAAQS